MDVTIWRTSRSTIVRELLDYSTAIFDRDGWNVAQAARIPSHLNSMSYFLTEILAKHIPADQWGPGRHRHLERSVLRRPASARYRRLQGGVSQRPAHRLRRRAVSPSRRRRFLARQLRFERHRDLPGGPANPAGEARSRTASSTSRSAPSSCRTCASRTLLWGDLQSQTRFPRHRRGQRRAACRQARRGAFRDGDPHSCSIAPRPACAP